MSILICYDGSPSAAHALSVAHATLGHKDAILLHVWSPPAGVLSDAFSTRAGPSGPSYSDLEALAVTRAGEVSDRGRELAAGLGLKVEVRQQRNDSSVWQTILDAAEAVDAELIVVGTHGATAVQSNLLGSVSNALAHHSERPVVLVPPGKRVRSGSATQAYTATSN
jgi:nucleotide-binding universal stress UspA family protein